MPLETSYRPTELLELLFTFVAEDAALNSDGLLTTLLCVCSRWRDIGTRVIWTNISLNPEKLARFAGSTSGSTYHSLVRSLTLFIPHIKPRLRADWNYADEEPPYQLHLEDISTSWPRGNADTRCLWENLKKLAILLPEMTSMTSFSFYVTEIETYHRQIPQGFWLRRSDLQAMLEALPESVKDLEIDTKGFDRSYVHDRHLCPQIASLISRRTNVRLRFSRICKEIIPTTLENGELETLVISTPQPTFPSGTKDCEMQEDGTRGSETSLSITQHYSQLRKTLTTALLRVEKGCENIKCLRLMDSVGPTINRRDLLSRTTSSWPQNFLCANSQADGYHAIRTLQDGLWQDSCGRIEELEQSIEGSPWVETTAENRLALKNASSHAQRQFKLKSTLEERSLFQARSGIGCKLWDVESRAGCKLLFTREVHGFPDVKFLKRELLEDEESEEVQSDDSEESEESEDFDWDWDLTYQSYPAFGDVAATWIQGVPEGIWNARDFSFGRWRDIGVRSLWTQSLSPRAQLEAFLSVPTPSNYVLIKSLTLLIVPLRPDQPDYKKWLNGEAHPLSCRRPTVEWTTNGSPVTNAFWKSLERLQVCLPMMVELQSFSFYVTSNIICPVGFWIRHCDVLQLLASLPSKVENLELDTKGIEVFKEAEQHLCPQIAVRIPRLRSLRLRLGRMCHEVMAAKCATSHLREIVINLLFLGPRNGTMECTAGQRKQSDFVTSNLRRTLVHKMLAIKDALHSASTMLVLDSSPIFVSDSDNDIHDGELMPTINRYDALATETLSEPVIGGARRNHEIRHFNESSQLDEDISGKFPDLEETIEGNTWVQTTKGLQLPRSCIPKRRRVSVVQPILELNAMRSEYEQQGFFMHEHALLLNEDEAGRPLLATRRTPGLGDVEPLRREEVDGEPFEAETEFLDLLEPPVGEG